MNNIKKEANLKIKKEIIKTIGCIRRYKSEKKIKEAITKKEHGK